MPWRSAGDSLTNHRVWCNLPVVGLVCRGSLSIPTRGRSGSNPPPRLYHDGTVQVYRSSRGTKDLSRSHAGCSRAIATREEEWTCDAELWRKVAKGRIQRADQRQLLTCVPSVFLWRRQCPDRFFVPLNDGADNSSSALVISFLSRFEPLIFFQRISGSRLPSPYHRHARTGPSFVWMTSSGVARTAATREEEGPCDLKLRGKIAKGGVQRANQLQLSLSTPTLDLLLAGNR